MLGRPVASGICHSLEHATDWLMGGTASSTSALDVRDVLDHLPHGILVIECRGAQCDIVHANAAFARITGPELSRP